MKSNRESRFPDVRRSTLKEGQPRMLSWWRRYYHPAAVAAHHVRPPSRRVAQHGDGRMGHELAKRILACKPAFLRRAQVEHGNGIQVRRNTS